ncbi:group-specific protein [Virgibacillus sp. C22-A2]|uniref:Group-specific protein n=1 Tax=Virgibacillus tibetensis TaxID=3042313 RepID=A0ABU6KIU9_9BACI|nr:group-specific protein [Virgibacillus sp. C22-A2]
MKFYIASGFRNKQVVRYVSQKLLSQGYTHTYDWTLNQRATSPEQLRKIGTLEKQAIVDCEALILLLPAGYGSHTELGMALALGKRVYIYSEKEIEPATASTFYFVDGVIRTHGDIDKFIERIGLV